MESFPVVTGVLALLLGLFLYLWHLQKRQFSVFKDMGIAGPKPTPFLGNAMYVSFDAKPMMECVQKWRREYGNVFGYYPGFVPALMVCDLDFIKQVGIKDFAHFTDRFTVPGIFGDHSLLSLCGQRWKDVRKHLSPAFSTSKLRQLTPIMKTTVTNFEAMLKRQLEKDGDCDAYDICRRLTLDTIGESALAMKIDCQLDENSKYFEQLKNVSQSNGRINRFFVLWFCFPFLAKLTMSLMKWHPIFKTFRFMMDNLRKVLKVRREMSSELKTVDMMQLMLDASKEVQEMADAGLKADMPEAPLSDDEIVGNCFIFVFAGFETTAITLSFLTYALSIHQDVQEKVHEEIMDEVKDLSNVTYDDVSKLHYLSRVIKETMRIYPPGWITNRICTQDYEYAGIKIKKGMRVDIPIQLIHHDPDVWPEPEKFDPDRFLPENKEALHPAAYMPFGIGPRNCIAMRFALLEMKLALVSLLSKYRIVPPTSLNLPPEKTFPTGTMMAGNGVFVKVEPRV